MAFDYGTRKIGVAVGQAITATAQGVTRIIVGSTGIRWEEFDRIVEQWKPGIFVVGLALDMNGAETHTSKSARNFGKRLHGRFKLPVYWVNEQLTSQAAQAYLKETLAPGKKFSRRKQSNRDLLAAELILRSYFESHTTSC